MRSSPGEALAVSVVREHQTKRFIGRAERGCDFLGFVLHPHRHLEPSPTIRSPLAPVVHQRPWPPRGPTSTRNHQHTKPDTGNTSSITAVLTYRCTQVNEHPPTKRSHRAPPRRVGQRTTPTHLPITTART